MCLLLHLPLFNTMTPSFLSSLWGLWNINKHTHAKCRSHSPQSHTSSHHFVPLFLLFLPSLPVFLCSPLSSLSLVFSGSFLSLSSIFVGGGRLKSLLRHTLSATFVNHTLVYLFFHFLPLPSFVGFLYVGHPPHSNPTTPPFPEYCPACFSILSSFSLVGTLWSNVLLSMIQHVSFNKMCSI